jgi:hypothetical protein
MVVGLLGLGLRLRRLIEVEERVYWVVLFLVIFCVLFRCSWAFGVLKLDV